MSRSVDSPEGSIPLPWQSRDYEIFILLGKPAPREGRPREVEFGVGASTHYRLVIADDHPLFRGALREAVTGLFEPDAIAEAESFGDISKLLNRHNDVDLVLLDLAMPGVRGFSGLMYMRAQYPGIPVVIVSGNDDPASATTSRSNSPATASRNAPRNNG